MGTRGGALGHTTPEQGTRIFESPGVLRNDGDPYPGPCIQQGAWTPQGTMEIINLDLGSACNRVLRPQGWVHEAILPLTGGYRFYQGIISVLNLRIPDVCWYLSPGLPH